MKLEREIQLLVDKIILKNASKQRRAEINEAIKKIAQANSRECKDCEGSGQLDCSCCGGSGLEECDGCGGSGYEE